jgi:beta-galactosidase
MKDIIINKGWDFYDLTNKTSCKVNLPHDATIGTYRDQGDADNPVMNTYFLNVGFKGIKCIYRKKIYIPKYYASKALYLEFNGIYRDFTVELNGMKILEESYGYIPYDVRIEDKVRFGEENEIKVTINTPEKGHNRWYAGSGIYQDVILHIAEKTHIKLHGVKITTESLDPKTIKVETALENGKGAKVFVKIKDEKKVLAFSQGETCQIAIPNAELWSVEHPKLYTAEIIVKKDKETYDSLSQEFGLRTLSWNPEQGFLVNGVRTLLKGGCIHNDNGVIGMIANDITEERRIKNLKASGFNALRSAHHPMSPSLLKACDKYGMYVMDEAFDTWYRPKQLNGFHLKFMSFYEDVVKRMAIKDYNHPSVVMYSIGNEINEIGSLKGIRVGTRMIEIIKSIDQTRPLLLCPSMHMARDFVDGTPYMTVDEDAYLAQGPEYVQKDQQHYYMMYMKALSNTPADKDDPYPQKIREADEAVTNPLYSKLDIAGYNYYTANFPSLHQIHPERVLLGTETRGHLIFQSWKIIKENPYAIGDFIWTLQDHIGEANVGDLKYPDPSQKKSEGFSNRAYPWLLNDGGVVDLIGQTLPAVHKFRLCWGEEHGIFLASQPPMHNGIAPVYGCYKWTDTIDSWSYEGYQGKPTFIDVYSDADEVEVLINGKSLGKKTPVEYFAKFPCVYEPGEVVGIGYAADGRELYRTSLSSGGPVSQIKLTPDKKNLKAGTQDFCFINIDLADAKGQVISLPDRQISVEIVGDASIQGLGSANPITEEKFTSNVHQTYLGGALLVIRSGSKKGNISVRVSSPGLKAVSLALSQA